MQSFGRQTTDDRILPTVPSPRCFGDVVERIVGSSRSEKVWPFEPCEWRLEASPAESLKIETQSVRRGKGLPTLQASRLIVIGHRRFKRGLESQVMRGEER